MLLLGVYHFLSTTIHRWHTPCAGGQKRGQYIIGDVVRELTQPVDRDMYLLVTQAMLQYGKALLSTSAMAKYVMEKVGIQPHHRVLYFGSEGTRHPDATNDYQADTLLHGLQSLMSTPITDWPRTEGMYLDVTTFMEDELASCKEKPPRYARGFSYAYKMHEPFGIDRSGIDGKLQNPLANFDYIIFAVAHRGFWHRHHICGKVPRDRVVFVHGGDLPAPAVEQLKELHACAAHIFLREMTPSCTLSRSI